MSQFNSAELLNPEEDQGDSSSDSSNNQTCADGVGRLRFRQNSRTGNADSRRETTCSSILFPSNCFRHTDERRPSNQEQEISNREQETLTGMDCRHEGEASPVPQQSGKRERNRIRSETNEDETEEMDDYIRKRRKDTRFPHVLDAVFSSENVQKAIEKVLSDCRKEREARELAFKAECRQLEEEKVQKLLNIENNALRQQIGSEFKELFKNLHPYLDLFPECDVCLSARDLSGALPSSVVTKIYKMSDLEGGCACSLGVCNSCLLRLLKTTHDGNCVIQCPQCRHQIIYNTLTIRRRADYSIASFQPPVASGDSFYPHCPLTVLHPHDDNEMGFFDSTIHRASEIEDRMTSTRTLMRFLHD